MTINKTRQHLSILYSIMMILILNLTFNLIGKPYGVRLIIFLILIFITFYIFNIFQLVDSSLKYLEILKIFLLTFLFMGVSIFSKILIFKDGIIVFFILFFYLIIVKYLIYKYLLEAQKIILINNKKSDMSMIKSINDSKIYSYIKDIKYTNINDLKLEIENNKPDIIVNYDKHFLNYSEVIDYILSLKLKGVIYYSYDDFYEKFYRKLPISNLNKKWFLEQEGFEIYYNSLNRKIKRLLDVLAALLLGVVLLPVIFISFIIIKLESSGPALFIQERIGEGNKPFKIIKLRSMIIDAEKNGGQWAVENDTRITKFGKIIRKTRIDELPQLWNVLKGDMSFVGPRPERQLFIVELEKEIPFYNLRHTVKPGITGWAQVMYPYASSVEDSNNKLQYDLYYIKHHNTVFDILIMLKTITIVLFGKGR